jgi:MFS transporter, Spinster family, sphingosine-1-phosphate transporter
LTLPLGYMFGLIVATLLVEQLGGWRNVYYITGSLGLVLAAVIFFKVKELPRGRSEPEMDGLEQVTVYRFNAKTALALFRKPSLLLLFAQGFMGVFPWTVITYWFFAYLSRERGYDDQALFATMAPAVLVLAAGNLVGGALGDYFFKRTRRGRILVSMAAVLLGVILMTFTMNVPVENRALFSVLLMATALFIPIASPNVISTLYDITLPEVRSTALAVQYFIENIGAAMAPLIAGFISEQSSLHVAILSICVSTWLLSSVLLGATAYLVPRDIGVLRAQMSARAEQDKQNQSA